MKKVLLIMSHLGADCESLCESLYKSPLIDWHKPAVLLNHPDAVYKISQQSTKESSILMKEVLFNHYFNNKVLYKMCTFVCS